MKRVKELHKKYYEAKKNDPIYKAKQNLRSAAYYKKLKGDPVRYRELLDKQNARLQRRRNENKKAKGFKLSWLFGKRS
jgi:hypothetical protein